NALTVRAQRWDFNNPFQVNSGTDHPSRAEQLTQYATNVVGRWSRVVGPLLLMEFRGGYNGFSWKNDAIPGMSSCGCPDDTPEYAFPGLTIGGQYNYPNYTWQDTYSGRTDLSWDTHGHATKK